MRRNLRRVWSIAGVAFVAAFAVFAAYDWLVNAPKAKTVEAELTREFDSIAQRPAAKQREHYASHKTQQALVGSTYSASANYQEIRLHYDQELARLGWRLHREKPIGDWGRDFGGRTTEYCKGGYRASVQYAGQKASYGWVFALDLSWGLDSLMDRWKGQACGSERNA